MSSLFSRMMDYAVDVHFRKDRSGRLVFIPGGLKGKCYFVDSKSDEAKIRAFVKLYRSAMQLITWLSFPSVVVPAIVLDDYAGLSPRGHRLAMALGIPLFFWLVFVALAWMLWRLYRGGIPAVASSLIEVGPDVKGQLTAIARRPGRVWLVVAAILLLIAAAVLALLTSYHAPR